MVSITDHYFGGLSGHKQFRSIDSKDNSEFTTIRNVVTDKGDLLDVTVEVTFYDWNILWIGNIGRRVEKEYLKMKLSKKNYKKIPSF